MASLAEALVDMPGECWIVRGTDSRGSFWMTRYWPKMIPDVRSLKQAESMAHETASRMNALGATVQAVKQQLDRTLMVWLDVETP